MTISAQAAALCDKHIAALAKGNLTHSQFRWHCQMFDTWMGVIRRHG